MTGMSFQLVNGVPVGKGKMGGVVVMRGEAELDRHVDCMANKMNKARRTANIPKIRSRPGFFIVRVLYLASVFFARG